MIREKNVVHLIKQIEPLIVDKDINEVLSALAIMLSHTIKTSGANPMDVFDFILLDLEKKDKKTSIN